MTTERRTSTVPVNGLALREIRERTGISQADLAAEVGTSRAYITKLELGHSRQCSPQVYAAIIRALKLRDYRTLQTSPAESAAVA